MVTKTVYSVGRKKFLTKRRAMLYAKKKGIPRIKKTTYEGVITVKKKGRKTYW